MTKSGDRQDKSLKTVLVVAGALAFGWLTVEMAFKPFLDRLRGSIDRSNPDRDPDDDDAAPTDVPVAENPDAVVKEEKEEDEGLKTSD